MTPGEPPDPDRSTQPCATDRRQSSRREAAPRTNTNRPRHTMNKPIMILTVLLLAAGTATAQDWKEALKKAATTAADKLTDGQLTRYALAGTWNYTGPGVKFEGEDMASELAGAALEGSVAKQLEKAYLLAGVKPGACTFIFGRENDFTATAGKRTVSGTYEFDAATHVVTLHFAKGRYDLGAIPGHAYISGEGLLLVFPVSQLVDVVTALGDRIPSLATVTKLLKKYENVYVGFEFRK